MKGIFSKVGKKTSTAKEPAASLETDCSNKLIKAVRSQHWLKETPKVSQWNKDFTELFKHTAPMQVVAVLDWYAEHIGEDYVPVAKSSRMFREKFPQIEEQWKEDPKTTAASSEAKDIARRVLAEFDWPRPFQRKMESIVQRSLNAYKPFFEKLPGLLAELRENKALVMRWYDGNLLKYALDSRFFTSPKDFIRYTWMKAIATEVQRRGMIPTKYAVWRIRSSIFAGMGEELAQGYTGSFKRWERLAKHWEDWG